MNVYEISFERAIGDQQFGECPAYEHRGRVLVGGTTTTYTLTGLQEFSTYFITVTAVNVAGRNESLPVTVNTLMTGTLCVSIVLITLISLLSCCMLSTLEYGRYMCVALMHALSNRLR